MIVGCSDTQPTVGDVATAKADAPAFDVQWFEGDTQQAFMAARQQDKPLFLYWGAQWCPPCHELKATVFSEPSFIAKSRQFIAVYLDGDSPGAQQQAERFKVMGYPTLVVFNAEGLELTRIPNGLDLSAYATVLDSVLGNLQPVHELLTAANAGKALSAAECQAVAQHSWGQDPGDFNSAMLLEGLANARQQCPDDSTADTTALFLRQWIFTHSEKVSVEPEHLAAAKLELATLLEQPDLLLANFYLFLDAGEPLAALFGENEQPDNDVLSAFRQQYQQLADDTDQSLFNRIQVSRALYGVRGKGSEASLTEHIRKLTDQAQAMDRTDPKFHATINAAGNLLRESGALEEARDLLQSESEKSRYAYYFMSELAHIEQLLGNNNAALLWLQKAYQQSRGPATRFQWGVNYLSGLLELDPNNLTLIEQQFWQVFGELPSNAVMYQRSRVRLVSLQEALSAWAADDSSRKQLSLQLSDLSGQYLQDKHLGEPAGRAG